MKRKFFLFLALFTLGVFIVVESAQALRITLKRVVFEGPKRAEVLTIINSSNEERTYRLGWRNFVMTQDKSLVALAEGEEPPANAKMVEDMVRFAPRRFTLAPKSSQQVRMILRTPSGLADGEYRSHFWVRPEEDVEELRLKAERRAAKEGKKSGGVSLTMLAGVTMPVIVRKGGLSATASVTNLRATETGGYVDIGFSLIREGNRSVYGDINYVCNEGVGAYTLRTTRGIAVYTELNQRNFNLRIEKAPGQPRCSSLTVTFTQTDGFKGDTEAVLASAKTQVN